MLFQKTFVIKMKLGGLVMGRVSYWWQLVLAAVIQPAFLPPSLNE